MIGSMRSPDIQFILLEAFATSREKNLLEAFASLKMRRIYRPLQASRVS